MHVNVDESDSPFSLFQGCLPLVPGTVVLKVEIFLSCLPIAEHFLKSFTYFDPRSNSTNAGCVSQDEAEWHQADSEQYEAEGEGDLYEFGQECLDRIALALGGKTMVPLAEQALPQLMTDQAWQQRHAALICLAQIAEGCAKVMLQNKQVTGLVQMCKQVSLADTLLLSIGSRQTSGYAAQILRLGNTSSRALLLSRA